MNWDSKEIDDLLERALQEDLGSGDITTSTLVPDNLQISAVFIAKEPGVMAGLPIISRIFRKLDSHIKVEELLKDGDEFQKNSELSRVTGLARAILTGERVSLNLLQRLSGIATTTSQYVRQARPFGIQILDTRKTTPLLRILEKYAVKAGGGTNHRMGLYDAPMVKDNHLKIQRDFRHILKAFQAAGHSAEKVEIEVENSAMLREAMEAGVRWFLLDNMTPDQIRDCVGIKKQGMIYEVSGGVSSANFTDYLIPGIDAISIGGLTHSVKSIDISMEINYSR
jgi:nicotinate-nucleotide pyrophosphorylase (carboxylating)